MHTIRPAMFSREPNGDLLITDSRTNWEMTRFVCKFLSGRKKGTFRPILQGSRSTGNSSQPDAVYSISPLSSREPAWRTLNATASAGHRVWENQGGSGRDFVGVAHG